MTKKHNILLLGGGLALAILSILSLKIGAIPTAWSELLQLNLHATQPFAIDVIQLRLPQLLLCIIVGASLAMSGNCLQYLTNNPLACPSLLGITQGGATVVVMASLVYMHLSIESYIALTFLGGMLVFFLVMYIGKAIGLTPLRLTLIGVSLNALCYSLCQSLLIVFPEEAQHVLFSLNGSFIGTGWSTFKVTALPFVVTAAALLFLSGRLTLCALGKHQSQALGFNYKSNYLLLLFLSIFLASLAVSIAGPILFVGLIIPHILRPFVGNRVQVLMLASAIYGALLMVSANLAVKLINPYEPLPVGLLIGFIGAPVLAILSKINRGLRYEN